MMCLADTIRRHLQMGDKVRLRNLELMKLEIGNKVQPHAADVLPGTEVLEFIHLVALESAEGTQALYEGITFEREKD